MRNKKDIAECGSRQIFLDILRILATCAVVMLHTVTGVMDHVDMTESPRRYRLFLSIIDCVTWSVPVFIMISGYLFLNPEREIRFGRMLNKYCRRIAFALLLFGIPYACLEIVLKERTLHISVLGRGAFRVLGGESWSHMWYLYMILLLYLITPMLKRILQRGLRAIVYALLAVLWVGASVFPFINACIGKEMLPALPGDGIYLFYYLCGYLFVRGEAGRVPKRKRGLVCLGIILFAGMVLSRMVWQFPVRMAYNYPFTVMAALLIFEIGRSAGGSVQEPVAERVQRVSGLCFTIYLIHPIFVNILYKFLHITPLDYPIGISLPCFFCVILSLSLVGAWMLRKIPFLKKYVL